MKDQKRVEVCIRDVNEIKKKLESIRGKLNNIHLKEFNSYFNNRIILENGINKLFKMAVKLCSQYKSELSKQILESITVILKTHNNFTKLTDAYIKNYYISDKSRDKMIEILDGEHDN